jgi:hypothetical protein
VASRRFRERRSLGNMMSGSDRRLAYLEKRPGPKRLQPQVVTTDKIFRSAVVTDVIATGAVVEEKIDDNAVSTRTIEEFAVTNDEIANSAVSNRTIETDAIDARVIRANAITADEISADAITAGKISADAITAREISANAITADEISANAVTASELSANAVIAGKISADAITAREISANAITASEISANAITAGKISADAITAREIAANAITAEQISANAITAAKISAGSITTNKISANGISANVLTSGRIDAGVINVTNVNATNITTGVLSGRTVRTGSGGNRVEMSNTDEIRFYVNGVNQASIFPVGTGARLVGGQSNIFVGGGLVQLNAGNATFSASSQTPRDSFPFRTDVGMEIGGSLRVNGGISATGLPSIRNLGSNPLLALFGTSLVPVNAPSITGPPGPPGPPGPRGLPGPPGPPSDARLKRAVAPTALGMAFINTLRPVSFEWKDGKYGSGPGVQYGLIAQEIELAMSEAGVQNYGLVYTGSETLVTESGEVSKIKGVDYYQLIAPVIKSIQELDTRVTALENERK